MFQEAAFFSYDGVWVCCIVGQMQVGYFGRINFGSAKKKGFEEFLVNSSPLNPIKTPFSHHYCKFHEKPPVSHQKKSPFEHGGISLRFPPIGWSDDPLEAADPD